MTLADLLKKDNLEKYNIYDNKGNVYKYKNNELKLMKIVDDSLYSLEDLLSLEYNITKKKKDIKWDKNVNIKMSLLDLMTLAELVGSMEYNELMEKIINSGKVVSEEYSIEDRNNIVNFIGTFENLKNNLDKELK